jgi:hypothetical protein
LIDVLTLESVTIFSWMKSKTNHSFKSLIFSFREHKPQVCPKATFKVHLNVNVIQYYARNGWSEDVRISHVRAAYPFMWWNLKNFYKYFNSLKFIQMWNYMRTSDHITCLLLVASHSVSRYEEREKKALFTLLRR